MSGYEVWFANGSSSKMEKCTTIWKTKEQAQKYAARVERLGYDTVILPQNYKSPKKIGNFGGPLTKEIEINGKKYQMWGFDAKSKSSANRYADQLRRAGKDVIVKELKNPETIPGWVIFARKRPGRRIGSFGGNRRSIETHGVYYNKITEQKARDRVNIKLGKISTHNEHTYYTRIPWGHIMDAVTSEGFDGAMLTNINDNRPGRVHVNVGGNTWLLVTWYIMPVSKKYEIIAYVS
jgi:hypothetical protein